MVIKMKKLNMVLNMAIVFSGVELLNRMLMTYNNPIGIGAVWIGLVCLKSMLEVFNFNKENM